MKEITRYTYLNLNNRPDRKLLAESTAWRDGIPSELVHFWTGESSFQTFDEIGRHALEQHGFENFEPCIGQPDKPIVDTVVGQMYNIMRYLTDRVKREDTLEVFLHDDTCFATALVGQAHAHLNGLCRTLQRHGELNMMLLNPFYLGPVMRDHFKESSVFRPRDFYIGGTVYKGIKGGCDFAIVFSTKGAEYLRQMMSKHPPWRAVETLLHIEDWDLPGIFTTVFPCVKRYSNLIAGTDNFNVAEETPDMYL